MHSQPLLAHVCSLPVPAVYRPITLLSSMTPAPAFIPMFLHDLHPVTLSPTWTRGLIAPLWLDGALRPLMEPNELPEPRPAVMDGNEAGNHESGSDLIWPSDTSASTLLMAANGVCDTLMSTCLCIQIFLSLKSSSHQRSLMEMRECTLVPTSLFHKSCRLAPTQFQLIYWYHNIYYWY